MQRIQDSFGVGPWSLIFTIYKSWEKRELGNDFERGFHASIGMGKFNCERDYGIIKSSTKSFAQFEYEPKAMYVLKSVVQRCKERGIKVHVFVNPIHKRLYDILRSYGHEQKWEEIRKEVAQFAGKLYELEDADKYISNDEYYCDSSHYNAKIGNILKAQILSN